MTHPEPRTSRRLKIGAAAVLAAGLFVGSVAPSAATTWPPEQGFSGSPAHAHSSFGRHFWRGSQLSQAPVPRADMMAVADETEAMDAAVSYCAGRFRSYDSATGTYLGYDGNEHPCP